MEGKPPQQTGMISVVGSAAVSSPQEVCMRRIDECFGDSGTEFFPAEFLKILISQDCPARMIKMDW